MYKPTVELFDPVHERLNIAIEIVRSVCNELSWKVVNDARQELLTLLHNEQQPSYKKRPRPQVKNPKVLRGHPLLSSKKQRIRFWNRYRHKRALRTQVI